MSNVGANITNESAVIVFQKRESQMQIQQVLLSVRKSGIQGRLFCVLLQRPNASTMAHTGSPSISSSVDDSKLEATASNTSQKASDTNHNEPGFRWASQVDYYVFVPSFYTAVYRSKVDAVLLLPTTVVTTESEVPTCGMKREDSCAYAKEECTLSDTDKSHDDTKTDNVKDDLESGTAVEPKCDIQLFAKKFSYLPCTCKGTILHVVPACRNIVFVHPTIKTESEVNIINRKDDRAELAGVDENQNEPNAKLNNGDNSSIDSTHSSRTKSETGNDKSEPTTKQILTEDLGVGNCDSIAQVEAESSCRSPVQVPRTLVTCCSTCASLVTSLGRLVNFTDSIATANTVLSCFAQAENCEFQETDDTSSKNVECPPTDNHCVVFGTLDRLHYGHKSLLSCAALFSRHMLTVGVRSDCERQLKELGEYLESFQTRCEAVLQFLKAVKPNLKVNCMTMSGAVKDPYKQQSFLNFVSLRDDYKFGFTHNNYYYYDRAKIIYAKQAGSLRYKTCCDRMDIWIGYIVTDEKDDKLGSRTLRDLEVKEKLHTLLACT